MYRKIFEQYDDQLILVDFSPSFRLGDFTCSDDDYRQWLVHDAALYIRENLSQVKLLINPANADIIAYMALSTDAFLINEEEKQRISGELGMDIHYSSLPALKIGKLAVNSRYERQSYGAYMLWLALGTAHELNSMGVACRFLVVDADVTRNERTPEFYEKCGFVPNCHKEYRKKTQQKSMRFDIFQE